MFSWIYPSILSWEKPGIASLTTSVCVTGSKRVGEIYVEFRVDPVIFILFLLAGVVFSHVFFWCCTKMRENIYKSWNSENQRKSSVLKELRNEKGQPIYALPSHFIR